jgi:transposase
MDERMRFIVEHGSNEWTMTELCERCEISRKTGYKWLERYRLEGVAGLSERLVEAIIGLRRERPSWGARKIIGKLCERQPDAPWPTPSTAGEILKREGLVGGRRLRRRGPPRLGDLTTPQ